MLALQPAAVARDWIAQSSTNLDNMSRNPVLVLALSAFVMAPLWLLLLLIPLVIAYGAVQRWLGRLALVVTVVLSHVGASLCVMTAETVALTQRTVSSANTGRHDVGVSYGLAGAIGLLLVRVPPRFRAWYGLASVAGVAASDRVPLQLQRHRPRQRLADRRRTGRAGLRERTRDLWRERFDQDVGPREIDLVLVGVRDDAHRRAVPLAPAPPRSARAADPVRPRSR